MGLLRLPLAMSVMASHVGPVLGLTMLPGGTAVEVFFVVSGFYMSLILSDKYADPGIFYTNRFLRLYPTYLIVLAGTWAWFMITWAYLGRPPTNEAAAILIGADVVQARVERNLVGTDAVGDLMVDQGRPFTQPDVDGIVVRAFDANGYSPGALIKDNVVGAMGFGIRVEGIGTGGARMEGNTVGVSRDRRTEIPNAYSGILITDGWLPSTRWTPPVTSICQSSIARARSQRL